jgi:hypothetical protein
MTQLKALRPAVAAQEVEEVHEETVVEISAKMKKAKKTMKAGIKKEAEQSQI